MNFNWVIYCFLAHLLSINRFVSMSFPTSINTIFSSINTKIYLAGIKYSSLCMDCSNILMAINSGIWFYGFCWSVAYMYPEFDLLYFPHDYKWDYGNTPLSRVAWLCELISDFSQTVLMLLWYALILIKLRAKVSNICYKRN